MLNETLLKRIKALIALSIDASTTDAERKLALSHAARLMARHSIDLSAAAEPQIEIQEWKGIEIKPFGLHYQMEHIIYSIIANQFGCYVGFRPRTEKFIFYGFKTNIEIALYTIDALMGQGCRDLSAARQSNRTAGFAVEFWVGFQQGIRDRFSKVTQDEKSLALYDKVKNLYNSKVIGQQQTLAFFNSSSGGFNQGQTSAKEASIHAPLHSGSAATGRKGIC